MHSKVCGSFRNNRDIVSNTLTIWVIEPVLSAWLILFTGHVTQLRICLKLELHTYPVWRWRAGSWCYVVAGCSSSQSGLQCACGWGPDWGNPDAGDYKWREKNALGKFPAGQLFNPGQDIICYMPSVHKIWGSVNTVGLYNKCTIHTIKSMLVEKQYWGCN